MKKLKAPMDILVDHERRLTRLEVVMYLIAALTGAQFLGIRVFDVATLFGRWP